MILVIQSLSTREWSMIKPSYAIFYAHETSKRFVHIIIIADKIPQQKKNVEDAALSVICYLRSPSSPGLLLLHFARMIKTD